MSIYVKLNEQNRIISVISGNNINMPGYVDITDIPDQKNDLIWALLENDQIKYDDGYYDYRKINPGPPMPNYSLDIAVGAIQKILDSTAQSYGYDSILSASTYVNSTVTKFKNEADAFVLWRDNVWAWAYAYLADIEHGLKVQPLTLEELLSEMPKFIPPAGSEPVTLATP